MIYKYKYKIVSTDTFRYNILFINLNFAHYVCDVIMLNINKTDLEKYGKLIKCLLNINLVITIEKNMILRHNFICKYNM